MITLKFTGTHDEIVNDIKHMLDVLEGVKAVEVCKCGSLIEVKPTERPAPVAENAPSHAVMPAEAPVAQNEEELTPTAEPTTAPATEAQEAPAAEITAETVKAALINLRNKRGSTVLRELMKAHGAMTFRELEPDQYEAILKDAEKEIINGGN